MANDHAQDKAIVKLETNYLNMADKIDKLEGVVVKGFEELKCEIKNNYVSNEKFLPVKLLTYGFASILLTAFILAIIANVIK